MRHKQSNVIRINDREPTVISGEFVFRPASMAERAQRRRNRQLLAGLLLVVCTAVLGVTVYALLSSIVGLTWR